MITLDKIKLVTDRKHIRNMDYEVTTLVKRNNIDCEVRYKQIRPYNLYIGYNLLNSKCIIEVSGKALGDRYNELINKNNIEYCFNEINSLGICEMDVDGIISDSELISCDITRDVDAVSMPQKLALKSCLKHYSKFQIQKFINSGFTATKLVSTKSRQIRISFYDKHKELLKARNLEFLDNLNDRQKLLEYFDSRFRVEANVRTVSQIRELFEIDDNRLITVLNSSANPLLKIFDSVFEIPATTEITNDFQLLSYNSFSELKNALFLKECNYDPDTIDMVLNNCLSPKTNKGKYINKFNKLINSRPEQNENLELMKKLREGLH